MLFNQRNLFLDFWKYMSQNFFITVAQIDSYFDNAIL